MIGSYIVFRILRFFEGDIDKAEAWMSTPNPMLGNQVPLDMIKQGREQKLLKWIDFQLSENELEEEN